MIGSIGRFFRGLIVLGGLVAVVFQLINTSSCNFMYRLIGTSLQDEWDEYLTFGLWYQGANEVCYKGDMAFEGEYESGDKFLEGARSCQLISMAAGGIAMALGAIEWLVFPIPCGRVLQHLAFLVAWVTGFCVFMIFGMDGCGNYFVASDLQDQFDAVQNIEQEILQLDADPDVDFTLDTNVYEDFEALNSTYATDLVPSFVEGIPFGTKCYWTDGATYNLIACLMYMTCGFLLCLTPSSKPKRHQKLETHEEDDVDAMMDKISKTNLSERSLHVNGENLAASSSNDNKIV